jgi:hypothetical protein
MCHARHRALHTIPPCTLSVQVCMLVTLSAVLGSIIHACASVRVRTCMQVFKHVPVLAGMDKCMQWPCIFHAPYVAVQQPQLALTYCMCCCNIMALSVPCPGPAGSQAFLAVTAGGAQCGQGQGFALGCLWFMAYPCAVSCTGPPIYWSVYPPNQHCECCAHSCTG